MLVGRSHLRRLRPALACAALAAPLLLGTPAAAAVHAATTAPVAASWHPWLNSVIQNYGDTSGKWNGGDGSESVRLSDGRDLWFFSDTLYGPIRPDGTRTNNDFVHNSMMVMSGTTSSATVTATVTGPATTDAGGNRHPTSMVLPAGQTSDGNQGELWTGDGMQVGSNVEKFYFKVVNQNASSPGGWGFQVVGTQVVTMPVATITDPTTFTRTELPTSPDCDPGTAAGQGCTFWGASLLNSTNCPQGTAPCTYVYGEEYRYDASDVLHKYLHIARTPQGVFTDPAQWQYLDANGAWQTGDPSASARIFDGISEGFTVYPLGSGYVMVGQDGRVWGGNMDAYYASTPWGFTDATRTPLFTAPENTADGGHFSYGYRIHPEFSSGADVVVSYNLNTQYIDQACMSELTYDSTVYRPRFYTITLPSAPDPTRTPGTLPPTQIPPKSATPVTGEQWATARPMCSATAPPASQPPAPAGLTATGAGTDQLRWTEPGGGAFQYLVERRDTSVLASDPAAAWTRLTWPVWDSPCADDHTANCFTDAYLVGGHTYQYRLIAQAWVFDTSHQSPTSAAATVTLPALLQPIHDDKCADDPNGSTSNGTTLAQSTCVAGKASQHWALQQVAKDTSGNVQYRLQDMASGYCASVAGGSTSSGARIVQTTCNTATATLWTPLLVDAAWHVHLVNVRSGLCLDVDDSSTSDGARLEQAACSTVTSESWALPAA